MCTRPCLFHPFLLLIFLSSLQAFAQRQDVRLSPSEIVTYPLPQDAQIQSAARIGDITLVVWGTTVKRGDSVVNELRMQMLRGMTPIGVQRVVHSPEARPFGFVQVMSVGKEFLVLWNDRRDSVVATYMQRVDTTGERIGEEEKYLPVTITGLGLAGLRTASGRKLIFWSDSSSGAMRVYWREVDESTNQLGPVLGSYPGLLVQVFVPDSIPGIGLLIRRGDLPLLVDSLGVVKELSGAVAEHFRLSYYLNDDGSIATINRDTLMLYRSLFDAKEYKRVVIPLPKIQIDPWKIFPMVPPLILSRAANHLYRILYLSESSYLFDKFYEHDVILEARDLTNADTLQATESLVAYGSHIRRFNSNPFSEFILREMNMVCGCRNSLRVEFVVEGDEPYNRDNFYINELGNASSEQKTPLIPFIFPDHCAPPAEIPVTRIQNFSASEVRTEIDGDTVYLLASVVPAIQALVFANPGLMCRGDSMLVSERSVSSKVALLELWTGRDSARVLSTLDESVIADSIQHAYSDANDLHIDSVLRISNIPAISYVHRWSEYSLEQGVPKSYHQLALFYPTIDGWRLSKKIRPPDMGYNPFVVKSYNYDPDSRFLVGAVTAPIYVDYSTARPRSTIFAIDSHGIEQWSIDSVFNTFDPFTILPLHDREYLIISGAHALHMRERDTLGGFDLPSAVSNAAYDRLYGSYFLRRYFTTPSSLRLERYSLEGKLIDTGSVNFTAPPVDLFMAMNPTDSSLAFLYGGSGGVRTTLVDQRLGVHYNDIPISVTRDSVRNPAGVYRNDTLFAVWEDYRNGKGAIYGTSYPAERITSGVRVSGASESGDAIIELLPNPSMGSTELVVNLHTSAETSLQIIDRMGKVVMYRQLGVLQVGRYVQRLDLTSLASGIYTVLVHVGQQSGRQQLIVVQ